MTRPPVHPTRRPTLPWLALVALLVGPGALAQDGSDALDPLDVARVAEAAQWVADRGEDVWPGWNALAPVLLRTATGEVLIGHPAPPAGTTPSAITIAGRSVVVLEAPLTPGPVATSWPVAEVWTVAIPTRAVFQDVIDEVLGPGTLDLDDEGYVRALVHEGFHAFTLERVGGLAGLPRFGLEGSEGEAVEELSAWPDLEAHHRELGTALAAALEASTVSAAAAMAQHALTILASASAQLPPDAWALARSWSWLEGLARYADVRLARKAGDDPGPAREGLTLPHGDLVWDAFLSELRDPPAGPLGLRDRYAAFGAAQALLLDRLAPGWKARAIPGGEALDEILREAVRDSVAEPIGHCEPGGGCAP
jgi:hypothetical protein